MALTNGISMQYVYEDINDTSSIDGLILRALGFGSFYLPQYQLASGISNEQLLEESVIMEIT